MTRLHNATDLYWSVYRSRRQVRNLYMMLLLLMTTLALFACSWLALNLSKQVTKPVEALADAMQAIAAGDYAHRVARERHRRARRSGAQLQPHGRRAGGQPSRRRELHPPALGRQRHARSTPQRTGNHAGDHPQRRRHARYKPPHCAGQPRAHRDARPRRPDALHRQLHRNHLPRRGDGDPRPPAAAQPSHGLRLRRDGDDGRRKRRAERRHHGICWPPSLCSKPAADPNASITATSWCWRTPPSCCARRSSPHGARSPAASPTRSRTRSRPSRSPPNKSTAI